MLTVTEAGRAVGVSGRTIRRWCDQGRLAHIRTPGGDRRIDRNALQTLVQPGQPRAAANVDPLTQVGTWAAVTDEWAGWAPSEITSRASLKDAEIDLNGLIRNLNSILNEVEDALDRG